MRGVRLMLVVGLQWVLATEPTHCRWVCVGCIMLADLAQGRSIHFGAKPATPDCIFCQLQFRPELIFLTNSKNKNYFRGKTMVTNFVLNRKSKYSTRCRHFVRRWFDSDKTSRLVQKCGVWDTKNALWLKQKFVTMDLPIAQIIPPTHLRTSSEKKTGRGRLKKYVKFEIQWWNQSKMS